MIIFALLFIVFYLLFAIGVGVLAGSWERSGFLWFVIALVSSPLLSVLLLLALGKGDKQQDEPSLRCPDCNYMNADDAQFCANCGFEFET